MEATNQNTHYFGRSGKMIVTTRDVKMVHEVGGGPIQAASLTLGGGPCINPEAGAKRWRMTQ